LFNFPERLKNEGNATPDKFSRINPDAVGIYLAPLLIRPLDHLGHVHVLQCRSSNEK
jgi:hypothetical protein